MKCALFENIFKFVKLFFKFKILYEHENNLFRICILQNKY